MSRRARNAHPTSDAAPSELLGPSLEDLAQDPPDGHATPSELLSGGGVGGGGATAGAGAATVGAGAVPLAAPDEDDAPSELLGPLLEWPDLLGLVLAQLDPTDCALLSRVSTPWLAAVVSRGLPRAGKGAAVPLKLVDFVASVGMLAWAKANLCPWEEKTCVRITRGGHLEVLQWARENHCPWNEDTCANAARGGGSRGVEVGAGAPLPMGLEDVCIRRCGRAPGGVAVGAGAPLPVG